MRYASYPQKIAVGVEYKNGVMVTNEKQGQEASAMQSIHNFSK